MYRFKCPIKVEEKKVKLHTFNIQNLKFREYTYNAVLHTRTYTHTHILINSTLVLQLSHLHCFASTVIPISDIKGCL